MSFSSFLRETYEATCEEKLLLAYILIYTYTAQLIYDLLWKNILYYLFISAISYMVKYTFLIVSFSFTKKNIYFNRHLIDSCIKVTFAFKLCQEHKRWFITFPNHKEFKRCVCLLWNPNCYKTRSRNISDIW